MQDTIVSLILATYFYLSGLDDWGLYGFATSWFSTFGLTFALNSLSYFFLGNSICKTFSAFSSSLSSVMKTISYDA